MNNNFINGIYGYGNNMGNLPVYGGYAEFGMQVPSMNIPMPSIIETVDNVTRTMDPITKLYNDRSILIRGEVNSAMEVSVVSQLLALEQANPDEPVFMYINSPGGSVIDGLSIYDTMRYVSCPIYTIAMGMCASMGQFLLCAGDKGKRYALKDSFVMMHSLAGGKQGKLYELNSNTEFLNKMSDRLEHYIAEFTGHSYEEIHETAMYLDNWYNAEEAKEFGFVDHVIDTKADLMAAVREDSK